jgi:predicted rRNA methylase YqxC with S4 and FtsJ domains
MVQRSIVEKEVFEQKVYEKFFSVDKGDIVFDVGASVGPFTFTHTRKKSRESILF